MVCMPMRHDHQRKCRIAILGHLPHCIPDAFEVLCMYPAIYQDMLGTFAGRPSKERNRQIPYETCVRAALSRPRWKGPAQKVVCQKQAFSARSGGPWKHFALPAWQVFVLTRTWCFLRPWSSSCVQKTKIDLKPRVATRFSDRTPT